MNILDTDAVSHLQKRDDPVGAAIRARMDASPDQDFRLTTVSVYEMLSGAIALIDDLKRKRKALVRGFQLFQGLMDYLRAWQGRILPYDDAADQIYQQFAPRFRQTLGNDARSAAIALVHNAVIWTCNVDDFKRVLALIVYRAESGERIAWLDPGIAHCLLVANRPRFRSFANQRSWNQ